MEPISPTQVSPERLIDALGSLDAADLAVLKLTRLHSLSDEELARQLGVVTSCASALRDRALERLAAALAIPAEDAEAALAQLAKEDWRGLSHEWPWPPAAPRRGVRSFVPAVVAAALIAVIPMFGTIGGPEISRSDDVLAASTPPRSVAWTAVGPVTFKAHSKGRRSDSAHKGHAPKRRSAPRPAGVRQRVRAGHTSSVRRTVTNRRISRVRRKAEDSRTKHPSATGVFFQTGAASQGGEKTQTAIPAAPPSRGKDHEEEHRHSSEGRSAPDRRSEKRVKGNELHSDRHGKDDDDQQRARHDDQ
jgi:hypothetical protein